MLQLNLLTEAQHVIPISGKDSLACALLQTTRYPDRDYKFLFNDTGSELPETYKWITKVEAVTGWTIHRTTASIGDRIEQYNGYLPSHQNRWCTSECKIKPTDKYLSAAPAYVYYGLRADEPDRKGFIPTRRSNIHPIYPLREAGLGLEHVWAIVEAKGLLPPSFHWERLEKAVQAQLPEDRWIPLTKWQRRMLFAGRTRSNCFHCFYQRLYEWVWLYEVHPEFFYRAKSWEKANFTWNMDHPLEHFEDEAFREKQFDRRVRKLIKILTGQEKEYESEIAGTSCGLICGK